MVVGCKVNVIMADMVKSVRVSDCDPDGEVGIGDERCFGYVTADVIGALGEAQREDEDTHNDQEDN